MDAKVKNVGGALCAATRAGSRENIRRESEALGHRLEAASHTVSSSLLLFVRLTGRQWVVGGLFLDPLALPDVRDQPQM